MHRSSAARTRPRYVRPLDLYDALAATAEAGAVVLAGGTELIPERRALASASVVVDITAVGALRGICGTTDGWRIGSCTTWRDIARAERQPALEGLRAAARVVGGVQIQNAATIAGNVCTASPAADGVPPLLTLDCQVELQSAARGTRTVPLNEFLVGRRLTAREPDELITAFLLPAPPSGAAGAFTKFGGRSHLVISIAMVAALVVVKDGVIGLARVAVGACSPTARRLEHVESALCGCECDPDALRSAIESSAMPELSPIDDVRASAEYRRALVPELVLDVVTAAGALT